MFSPGIWWRGSNLNLSRSESSIRVGFELLLGSLVAFDLGSSKPGGIVGSRISSTRSRCEGKCGLAGEGSRDLYQSSQTLTRWGLPVAVGRDSSWRTGEVLTCHCDFPPRRFRVRPFEGRKDEASKVHRRADYWRAEGARGGREDLPISPASTAFRKRRCTIGRPSTAAWMCPRPSGFEAARRRERQAEEAVWPSRCWTRRPCASCLQKNGRARRQARRRSRI